MADEKELDISALVNEAVNKAISARMNRAGIDDRITKAVAEAVAKLGKSEVETPADAVESPVDRPTLKGQSKELADLRKAVEAERKAREAAETRSADTLKRSQLQAQLAKHLGADSPHLDPYLNYYLNRVSLDETGNALLKFQRDGFEETAPIEAGFKELLDSELKHLVQSRTSTLPPNVNGMLRGTQQYNQQKAVNNPVLDQMFDMLKK